MVALRKWRKVRIIFTFQVEVLEILDVISNFFLLLLFSCIFSVAKQCGSVISYMLSLSVWLEGLWFGIYSKIYDGDVIVSLFSVFSLVFDSQSCVSLFLFLEVYVLVFGLFCFVFKNLSEKWVCI